jgi:serine protease Do
MHLIRKTATAAALALALLGAPSALRPAAADVPAMTQAAVPAMTQAAVPAMTQAELVRKVLPTVVNITAHARTIPAAPEMAVSSPDTGESFEYKSSAGSGFVIDPSGVILTNWHVVAGAYEIFVTFSDGNRLDAEVVNAARLIDLALLKVKPETPLQAVTWGDSRSVQVGDSVLAIGNPLGIGTSVSRGIVSAMHRNISDTPYDDFVQTDAAINHGNSGGPLFDADGKVIGVNSAIISPTASNAGLGFALPAYQAMFVIDQLKKYGWVRPGWLGLKIQDVTPDIARATGMAQARGSIVAWVSANGPAEKSGLRIGDVIVRFEEDRPDDERALLRDISGSAPGRVVGLGVIRDGKPIELTVTLAEWPRMAWEEINAPLKVAPPRWVIPANLGLKLTALTDQLRTENDIPAGPKGAFVVDVAHDTDAARRGLVPGDVILQVGGIAVDSEAAVLAEVDVVRKTGRDMANFLVFPKTQKSKAFPSPKWIPLRVRAG